MFEAEFRYRAEPGSSGRVLRPLASVILRYRMRLECLMYVDSGADVTTIPWQAGVALGLRRQRGEARFGMRGIAGRPVTYRLKRIRIGFNSIEIPVRVAWAETDEVPFLLGRLDVFRRFDITFRERRGIILFHTAS